MPIFNSFREAYDAYFAAVTALNPGSPSSEPGPERDAALLPLSCVPVLAYDNHGLSYPIYIGPGDYDGSRNVLYAVGAPSGWYESDLVDRCHRGFETLAFDIGQGWLWVNFSDVMLHVVGREA